MEDLAGGEGEQEEGEGKGGGSSRRRRRRSRKRSERGRVEKEERESSGEKAAELRSRIWTESKSVFDIRRKTRSEVRLSYS